MKQGEAEPPTMVAPRFHHFAAGAWINDPVGLHRQDGLWVLHDQRSTGADDRAIGWGRATSSDLLHWTDEGIAIPPEADGWIYSGCVVPDGARTIAFFTFHRPSSGLQSQVSARWLGSWQRTPGECVSGRRDTRDPFVFRWGDEWRMLLAQPPPWDAPTAYRSSLTLLASADLGHWTDLGSIGPPSDLGEMFETPFLRRVPVAGESQERWPWLLGVGVVDRRIGAVCGTRAWLGRFDGCAFAEAGASFRLDHGPDFYAPAVWAGTDEPDVVLTGWCNSWAYARRLPHTGWSGGAHALPRRLSAVRGETGWSLRQLPAALPGTGPHQDLASGVHQVAPQVILTVEGTGCARLGDLTLTIAADALTLERETATPALADSGFAGRWTVEHKGQPLVWLIDGCVAELYSRDGAVWLTALTLRSANQPLHLGEGLRATLRSVSE
jgi:sucrose-6-phosphate hydrolase SacC (GH32 family)